MPVKRLVFKPGDVFGLYTVLEGEPELRSGGSWYWPVKCTCGHVKKVRGSCLTRGESAGCRGCLSPWRTHGEKRNGRMSPEYLAHRNMLRRCLNPKDKAFHYYGGRGVSVCAVWQGADGFSRFLVAVGRRPSSKHTLGRINNDGDYTAGNVRWETRLEQNCNTRQNVRIEVAGVTRLAVEWSRLLGGSPTTVSRRIFDGWDPVLAAVTPLGSRRK